VSGGDFERGSDKKSEKAVCAKWRIGLNLSSNIGIEISTGRDYQFKIENCPAEGIRSGTTNEGISIQELQPVVPRCAARPVTAIVIRLPRGPHQIRNPQKHPLLTMSFLASWAWSHFSIKNSLNRSHVGHSLVNSFSLEVRHAFQSHACSRLRSDLLQQRSKLDRS
jgi:hypothetical protein